MARNHERPLTQEELRLEESRQRKVHWKRWGPYLSEPQWGTDFRAGHGLGSDTQEEKHKESAKEGWQHAGRVLPSLR